MNNSTVTTLLSIGAIAGLAATVYFAIKETGDKKEKEQHVRKAEPLGTSAKVKRVGEDAVEFYKKTLVCGGLTAACIFGIKHVGAKEIAGLAASAAAAHESLKLYREKAAEIIGPENEAKIEKAVTHDAAEKVAKAVGPDLKKTISDKPIDPDQKIWVYESTSKSLYQTDIPTLVAGMSNIQWALSRNGAVSLNFLLQVTGGEPWEHGSEYGWCIDEDPDFDSVAFYVYTDDTIMPGTPVFVIDYMFMSAPTNDFAKRYEALGLGEQSDISDNEYRDLVLLATPQKKEA